MTADFYIGLATGIGLSALAVAFIIWALRKIVARDVEAEDNDGWGV